MISLSKPIISAEEKKGVDDVIESGMLASGPRVKQLEKEFEEMCSVPYAIAVNNGTAALHTALHAVGVQPFDEVITTPFTFVATANSILMAGATPVFADIDPETYNIDLKEIEKQITSKTKAIVIVDLYGQPVNYEAFQELADKYSLKLIEDAAQSVNAEYRGLKTGSLVDIATFSLYATKNIMSGEGGMVTTQNEKYANAARLFRSHGQDAKNKYLYHSLGYNYRMMDLQAAIALAQLQKIDVITKRRQEIASRYTEAFAGLRGIIPPYVSPDVSPVYHQYTIRITRECPKTRDEVKHYLEEKEIQSGVYYPIPLYAFNHLSLAKRGEYPATEQAVQEVLSIPVHPSLSDADVTYIIDTIKSI